VAAHRTGLTTATRTERITAEERVEQVAEAGERVAGTTGAGGAAAGTVAEDVVTTTAFWVTQHLVRSAPLLEPLDGLRVVGIRVGVELAGEVSIRALDLVVGCVPADAEHFVVIAHEIPALRAF